MDEIETPESSIECSHQPPLALLRLKRWKWWVLVVLNIAFLLIGQSGATLLGKFYFDEGGKSTWMGALVQAAGFPVLFLPLLLFASLKKHPNTSSNTANPPSRFTVYLVYLSLGALLAADNWLYSLGLLYLPISTYSIISASQLVFNAIFSFFINSQKLSMLILNSVVLVTLSASLVAVHGDSSEPKTKKASEGKEGYLIGFLCTVAASAGYSLLLSLMQLTFEKVLKEETFSVVLEMQIYTSTVATCLSILGLFASGEGMDLKAELERFRTGRVSYVMSLVGAALAWQVSSVGMVGLIFLVSSLFSNVVSMLALPFVPMVAVLYGEKMDDIKIVAMFMTIWGFASYLYQEYLDDSESKVEEFSPTPGIGDCKFDEHYYNAL